MHVGQAEVAAGVAVGQPFVILDRREAEVISLAVTMSAHSPYYESSHATNAISDANMAVTIINCTIIGVILRRTELMTAPQCGQT
jgi:hypothetical protein